MTRKSTSDSRQNLIQEVLTVHVGHAQVADDQIETARAQLVEGVLPVAGQSHGMSISGQGFLAYFSESGLVIHNQHLKRCSHLLTSPAKSVDIMMNRPKFVTIYVHVHFSLKSHF